MKVRNDFVTNSSSSSFIISKDYVTKDRLEEILLEIANKEHRYYDNYGDTDIYTKDDIEEDCVAFRYRIIEGTMEHPYTEYDDYEDNKYTNHYIVDNDSCGRYDWDVIKEVLDKYDIPWEYGYCD